MTKADLDASVVSVRKRDNRIVGTGFVAGERLILTCAHVIVQAGSEPGGTVTVCFQLNGEVREARVSAEAWRPPEGDDIAVLRLADDLPPGVAPLRLGAAEGSAGHQFRAFGYPTLGKIEGVWATGEIKGLVRDTEGRQMLQLASAELTHGLSGGPVLDETRQQVVGMVTAVNFPDRTTKHRDTALAIPTETLWQACPTLVTIPRSHITNPFYTGGRINDPQLFFGRRRLIREIQAELKKRSSVSLVGESQMGKSSLLYYLYATRTDWLPEVTLEYIDLQGILNEADFCETVCQKLGVEGCTLRHLKRTLAHRDVILLFDEMERLAEADFNPRLHDLLRALAQERHFAMGLATQRPLVEVFPARTSGGVSPFHNIFTVKNLGPFSEAEARAFLAARLAETGLTFTDREIERLLTESQGHPAKLQALAKALFADKVSEIA